VQNTLKVISSDHVCQSVMHRLPDSSFGVADIEHCFGKLVVSIVLRLVI